MTAQDLKEMYANWGREHNSQSEGELFWMTIHELEKLEEQIKSLTTPNKKERKTKMKTILMFSNWWIGNREKRDDITNNDIARYFK